MRAGALATAATAALAVLAVASGAGARLDAWFYDALSGLHAAPADQRIALVEIDQASIGRIGPWPWSRRVHARLLERLTEAGARGVALDLLLSEPALFDPEGDALLARAIDRNGKVVLPVYAAAGATVGTPVELLPIREFASAAAALGHVEQARDIDGRSRSLYLRGGVGAAHWPALSLAMLQLGQGDEAALRDLPALHVEPPAVAEGEWLHDRKVMLPHAAGRDAYDHFSYADVLEGGVPEASLRGRWILVTPVLPALGAGPAGVQGPGSRMAAVDYQLAALDALVQERSIVPLSLIAQILMTTLLVLVPALAATSRGLHALGAPALVATALVVLLTWVLLRYAQLWFPPGAALLLLAVAGAAWAAHRLRQLRQTGQVDPLTGLANRQMFFDSLQQELRSARRSGQSLSLLLLEVDQLPEAGQSSIGPARAAALRTLATVLCSRARRPRDLVARLGGGRFAILLPETTGQAAAAIATTIHVDLANRAMAHDPARPDAVALTASIGLHTTQADEGLAADDLVAKADTARASAGRAGGNRTASYAEIATAR